MSRPPHEGSVDARRAAHPAPRVPPRRGVDARRAAHPAPRVPPRRGVVAAASLRAPKRLTLTSGNRWSDGTSFAALPPCSGARLRSALLPVSANASTVRKTGRAGARPDRVPEPGPSANQAPKIKTVGGSKVLVASRLLGSSSRLLSALALGLNVTRDPVDQPYEASDDRDDNDETDRSGDQITAAVARSEQPPRPLDLPHRNSLGLCCRRWS